MESERAAGEPNVTMTLFNWFCASRSLSLLADHFILFAIPVYIYAETGSIAYSGMALAAQWLPRVILLPVLGTLVDMFALRRQMIFIDVLRLPLIIALAMSGNIYLLLGLLGLTSLLGGHAFIALESIVANHFAPLGVARSQSRLQMIEQVTQMLGPALGGILLAWLDLTVIAAVALCLIAGSLSILLTKVVMVEPARRTGGRNLRGVATDMGVGARRISRSPVLKHLIVLTMLMNFSSGMCIALMPAIMPDVYGTSEMILGYVVAGAAVASFAALAILPRLVKRWSVKHIGLGALSLFIATGFLLSLNAQMAIFAALFAIYHVAMAAFAVYLRTERLTVIPKAEVGKVLGLFVALVLATYPLAGLALPFLSANLGPLQIVLVGAVVMLIGSLPGMVKLMIGPIARARQATTVGGEPS